MAWNPDTYNKFRSERKQPFYDCLQLVAKKPGMQILDLGCGTGELTYELAKNMPDPMIVLGIDSSADMLSGSGNYQHPNLSFRQATIQEQLRTQDRWDLIFSHAALQWIDEHEILFPCLIDRLKTGGQLLVQMPSQDRNITNILLGELAARETYAAKFENMKRKSSVLDPAEYAEILFRNGGREIQVFEKIYPVVVPDVSGLIEWISGTALIPYLERLSDEHKKRFVSDLSEMLRKHFAGEPIFYPFRRIILSALF